MPSAPVLPFTVKVSAARHARVKAERDLYREVLCALAEDGRLPLDVRDEIGDALDKGERMGRR